MSHEQRLKFASKVLEARFFGAYITAIEVRKDERQLTQAVLAARTRREKTGISKLLSGPRNWKLSTISDLTEALELNFEFALVDRLTPTRRFTATGVRYDIAPSFAFNNLTNINAANLLTGQISGASLTLPPQSTAFGYLDYYNKQWPREPLSLSFKGESNIVAYANTPLPAPSSKLTGQNIKLEAASLLIGPSMLGEPALQDSISGGVT
jgi:hypothetical protein